MHYIPLGGSRPGLAAPLSNRKLSFKKYIVTDIGNATLVQFVESLKFAVSILPLQIVRRAGISYFGKSDMVAQTIALTIDKI